MSYNEFVFFAIIRIIFSLAVLLLSFADLNDRL